MTILHDLMYRAEQAEKTFDDLARWHRFTDGRWGYYQALERGDPVPEVVSLACDEYLDAVRTYYEKRDGYKGFLGSRGI